VGQPKRKRFDNIEKVPPAVVDTDKILAKKR
jgi:hypothetical protein